MSRPSLVDFYYTDPLPPLKRASWLRGTVKSIGARVKEKFGLGAAQYKGDFGEQTVDFLLEQIEQEAIDQLMYVRELKRRRATQLGGAKQGELL